MILHSKNGWRKSNLYQFDLGNWFWLCIIAQLVWRAGALCTCREECNKYDLTAAQCFWLAHHNNNWSRWFVSSSSQPICCPSFSFIGGVAKEYITKLGCEKYFRRVTYWASLEMLLDNHCQALELSSTDISQDIFCHGLSHPLKSRAGFFFLMAGEGWGRRKSLP